MLSFAIFIVTLTLVVWQPRGLGIGWSAMGGAIALLTGVIRWHDVPVVWHIVWDATFTFVGLLWLNVLSRKGITISWGQYMRVGLIIIPPVLVVVLLALAFSLPIVGAA